MAEEHRCQAPRLCANNCGFFGSPGTQDLCSKCHRDLQLKEQQSSSAKLALNQSLVPSQPLSSAVSFSFSSVEPAIAPSSSSTSSSVVDAPPPRAAESDEKARSAVTPNRCATCRKRVGLTGFKCRCGLMLCRSHRYPEGHGCGFDFKGMGKELIAKANPMVKGEKLHKI